MDELIFQRADGSGLMDAKCKPLGQLIVVLELIKCKKIYINKHSLVISKGYLVPFFNKVLF